MSFLFASAAPSYAEEQLKSHLSSLSTLSIAPAAQFSPNEAKPSPALEAALHDLSASKTPDHEKLVQILRGLAKQREAVSAYATEVDKLVEAEVLGRAVILVWKEVLQALVEGALQLEEERSWWDSSLLGRRGVLVYLVQSEHKNSASRISVLTIGSPTDPPIQRHAPSFVHVGPIAQSSLVSVSSDHLQAQTRNADRGVISRDLTICPDPARDAGLAENPSQRPG